MYIAGLSSTFSPSRHVVVAEPGVSTSPGRSPGDHRLHRARASARRFGGEPPGGSTVVGMGDLECFAWQNTAMQ